jgi:acetyl esterase/lipase
MIRSFLLFVVLSSIAMALPPEIKIWDGNMPGVGAAEPEGISPNKKNKVTRLINVSEPTIRFYPAKVCGESSPVVIVCPGGGYNILAYDLEGTEIAEWLNSIGVSAAILKYRVPQNREGALEDARRAVRMVREKAEEWNIDPERVGMLGFSAGGHLTAACSNSPDRPNFSVLVYPAYLFQKGGIELAEDIQVDEDTPPAFVVQTRDDKNHYRSTLAYSAALDALEIPIEVHMFAKGGHGYGLRPSEHPVSKWPELCEAWMREMGFLK